MSEHSVCFINGQSGNCNEDCAVFAGGECEAGDEIVEQCPIAWIDAFLTGAHGEVVVFTLMNDRRKKNELVCKELGYE